MLTFTYCKPFCTQHYSFIVIDLEFHEAIKFSFLSFMFPTAQRPELALECLLTVVRQGVIFFPSLVWGPAKPLNHCGRFQNIYFTQKSTGERLILNH